MRRILIRATNWLGDAVMALPALAAVRRRFPRAHITIVAKPWVADLYRREPFSDELILYRPANWRERRELAERLRSQHFDAALLFQNAFEAALLAWLARIPERIGYARDGRSPLLTRAIPVPRPIPESGHESYYYLELLRRCGWLDELPPEMIIRLDGRAAARIEGKALFGADGIHGPVIGVSPGAAYGSAKRWPTDRFTEAARLLAQQMNGHVALFGSAAEGSLCEEIERRLSRAGIGVTNYAGATSLANYIDRTAACDVYLTNDSGAMHIASALAVPTVAVFGPTDFVATGPTGPLARIVHQPVACSPCLLRECPIDHRCMIAVRPQQAVEAALGLLQLKASGHTQ